jgi:hypothetical protein
VFPSLKPVHWFKPVIIWHTSCGKKLVSYISYGYDRQHNYKAEYVRVKTRTDADMYVVFKVYYKIIIKCYDEYLKCVYTVFVYLFICL